MRVAKKDPGRKKKWKTVGNRNPENAIALARLAFTFGHPLRVQILQSLADKVGSAKTISNELGVSLGNVSHHLNDVLFRECGYVEVVKERQIRGATEYFFRIDTERILSELDWATIAAPLRPAVQLSSLFAFAEHAVAALGDALAKDGELVGQHGEIAFATWRPGAVDESGWREVEEILVEARDRIVSVLDESAERLDEGEGINLILGLGAFEAVPVSGGDGG